VYVTLAMPFYSDASGEGEQETLEQAILEDLETGTLLKVQRLVGSITMEGYEDGSRAVRFAGVDTIVWPSVKVTWDIGHDEKRQVEDSLYWHTEGGGEPPGFVFEKPNDDLPYGYKGRGQMPAAALAYLAGFHDYYAAGPGTQGQAQDETFHQNYDRGWKAAEGYDND
jgi:hypothetical protein